MKEADQDCKVKSTNQSNPAAKDVSMAGAMSLAAVMMYFSDRCFLCKKKKTQVKSKGITQITRQV